MRVLSLSLINMHVPLHAGEPLKEDPDEADAEQGTPAPDDEDEGAAEEPEEEAPAAAAATPAVAPIPAEIMLERPAGATPVNAPTDALGTRPLRPWPSMSRFCSPYLWQHAG